jgi:GNAT superfamily N-acetyltransferase
MIEHAERNLCNQKGELELKIFQGQTNMIDIAQKCGYIKVGEAKECIYEYKDGALNHQLPEGFSFELPKDIDIQKELLAIWRGFENEEDRPEGDYKPTEYGAVKGLDVIVKNEVGDYVCCAGMYFVPENKLAYMEPLATLKEYRNRGIASAVLSEMYRRTLELGATHMTGGYNKFYYDLGFKPLVVWTSWKKGE